jgi:hypothetical protein
VPAVAPRPLHPSWCGIRLTGRSTAGRTPPKFWPLTNGQIKPHTKGNTITHTTPAHGAPHPAHRTPSGKTLRARIIELETALARIGELDTDVARLFDYASTSIGELRSRLEQLEFPSCPTTPSTDPVLPPLPPEAHPRHGVPAPKPTPPRQNQPQQSVAKRQIVAAKNGTSAVLRTDGVHTQTNKKGNTR